MSKFRLSCPFILVVCFWLSACAPRVTLPVCSETGGVLTFEQAIADIAQLLNSQIVQARLRARTIVFDPFVDVKNAQELKINTQIMEIMARTFGSGVELVPLTVENLQKADLVLTGVILSDDNSSGANGKAYHIFASALETRGGIPKARACTWAQNVDLTPLGICKDTPVYLRDIYLRNQEAAAKAANVEYSHTAYINHLETRAMLQHAYQTYEKGDYKATLAELDAIINRPDGVAMASYSAQYMTHIAMDDLEGARPALVNLFKLGAENEKVLDVKFLFDVNSDILIKKTPRQAKEYDLWLQEIARLAKNSDFCLQIVGHSSHTGAAAYNEALSLKRAKTVQKLICSIHKTLGQKTKVLGRGFSENIVGSGTDDIQDMIDRRVEFKIMECGVK